MNDLARLSLVFVVGLAGGLAGSVLFGGGPSGATGGDSGASAGSPDRLLASLQDRMLAAEGAIESQRLAYDDLDGRMIALSRRADTDVMLANAGGAAALGGEGATLGAADMPTGQAFDAAVNAAIERREELERQQREAEREQRREERVAELADRITADLGLDATQSKVVKDAISESWAAREALFAGMRDNPGPQPQFSREEIGQKMADLRTQELDKVGAVLTPAQLETYTAMTNFGGRGGFGGDAGGGRQRGGQGGATGGGRDF